MYKQSCSARLAPIIKTSVDVKMLMLVLMLWPILMLMLLLLRLLLLQPLLLRSRRRLRLSHSSYVWICPMPPEQRFEAAENASGAARRSRRNESG